MNKPPKSKQNADGGSMMSLVVRLRSAVAHMAPHQREREQGKLILDCCDVVGGAVRAIAHLEACLEEGAKIEKQDGQWHIFAADGEGLKTRDSLAELIADIPPLNAERIRDGVGPPNQLETSTPLDGEAC